MTEMWIGLFEVAPRPGVDFDGAGAYVQVVGPATSATEHVTNAKAALAEVGFDAVESEDIYPLGPDWPPADAEPSLIQAVEEARERRGIAWGDWHTFPHEDDST